MKQPPDAGRRLQYLVAITALIIAYGSLYPFQFYRPILPANPFAMLVHSWPAGSNAGAFLNPDALINVLVYMPLGALAYLLCRRMRIPALSFSGPLLLSLLLSSSVEMTQLFVRSRVCSAFDVICNVAGAVLGSATASLFESKLSRATRSVALRPAALPSAFFLTLCWVCFQSFPFIPDISRALLLAKLSAFRDSAMAPVVVLTSAAGALAFVEILDQLVYEKLRNFAILLIIVLAPIRFLLPERTLNVSEMAAFLLGCAAWYVLLRSRLSRPPVIAGLLAASILLGGLTPFRFTAAAQPFGWIPFTGLLAGDWQWSFVVLFRKLFTYGALVWFLRESRIRLVPAALCAAAILAFIEAIQTHLPGRTAEITDPLLALLSALLFYLLDQTFGKDSRGEGALFRPVPVSHRLRK